MTRAERNLAMTVTHTAKARQSAKENDPKGKQWWRIEVDAAGKVVSCEQVELKERDQACVFFVEAKDRAQAGRRAWNAHCKVVQRRRRAQLHAEGKCPWCARENDRSQGRCSECQKKDALYSRRRNAKARGEEVPDLDRTVAIAARAHVERKELRLKILTEVSESWARFATHDEFARWLASEIVAAGGRDKRFDRAS